MKIIVYHVPDNPVLQLCVPAPKAQFDGEGEAEFIERIKAKDVPPNATDVSVINSDDLPTARAFRNAWTRRSGQFVHDMGLAREVHRNRLRDARRLLLPALDVEYQRADESGDMALKKEVAKKKQALRDVTADPRIPAAKNISELSEIWPDVLGPAE